MAGAGHRSGSYPRVTPHLALGVKTGELEDPADARGSPPDDRTLAGRQGPAGRRDHPGRAAVKEVRPGHVEHQPPGPFIQHPGQVLGKDRQRHQVQLADDKYRGRPRADVHRDLDPVRRWPGMLAEKQAGYGTEADKRMTGGTSRPHREDSR